MISLGEALRKLWPGRPKMEPRVLPDPPPPDLPLIPDDVISSLWRTTRRVLRDEELTPEDMDRLRHYGSGNFFEDTAFPRRERAR